MTLITGATAVETLLSLFRTTDQILSLSLADLTDRMARTRIRNDSGASIAWTVGHLLDHRYKVLALLGSARPSPWASRFGDTAATDGSDYPTLAALREAWGALHGELEAAFAAAGPDRLAAPGGSGTHGEATVRDRVAFLAWHEGYHLGVIGACRKAAGLRGPAELAQAAAKRQAAPAA